MLFVEITWFVVAADQLSLVSSGDLPLPQTEWSPQKEYDNR